MEYFDTNDDGTMRRGEFRERLVELCQNEDECVIEGMLRFRQANQDRKGGVTMKELEHAFENGPIDQPPPKDFPALETAEDVMAAFDSDGNGKIWWKEFNKALFSLCNMNDRCIETGRFYFREANTDG